MHIYMNIHTHAILFRNPVSLINFINIAFKLFLYKRNKANHF